MALSAAQVMTGTGASSSTAATVGGTSWHVVIMWFLGAIILLTLADPWPKFTTWLVVLIIAGVILNNWSAYQQYFSSSGSSTTTSGG